MNSFHDRVPLKDITAAARRALSEAYVERQKQQGRGCEDVEDLVLVTTVSLPDGKLAGLVIVGALCETEDDAIMLGETLFSSAKRGLKGWREGKA